MNGAQVEKTGKVREASSARQAAKLARTASRKLAVLSEETRNTVLQNAAERLEENTARILAANQEELRAAEELAGAGKMSAAVPARPRLTDKQPCPIAENGRR